MSSRGVCQELIKAHTRELSEHICASGRGISSGGRPHTFHLSPRASSPPPGDQLILECGEVVDISGDMNHVYRVTIHHHHYHSPGGLPEDLRTPGDGTEPADTLANTTDDKGDDNVGRKFSVVVKMAPNDVLYLKKEEGIAVDPNKIFMEHAALCKFHSLQEHSVPKVYVLDTQAKDMCGYEKLTELLMKESEGNLQSHIAAVERAMRFMGHVHRQTWLADKTEQEAKELMENFSHPSMRRLMSELLFDRPFDPSNVTNRCHPRLLATVDSIRRDPRILEKVAEVKNAFLTQNDCLCHGDLSPDNLLVVHIQFRVIDLEFSGIGLRAYDLALFLREILFQLLVHHFWCHRAKVSQLWWLLERVLKAYAEGMGQEGAGEEEQDDPVFVDQVCSLIACEFMWIVFGSYVLEEFGGEPKQEEKLLSIAKSFLLHSNSSQSIAWNIREHLNSAGYSDVF